MSEAKSEANTGEAFRANGHGMEASEADKLSGTSEQHIPPPVDWKEDHPEGKPLDFEFLRDLREEAQLDPTPPRLHGDR